VNDSNLGDNFYDVERIAHYNRLEINPWDDLAMLKLSQNLNFNDSNDKHYHKLNSICLPKQLIYNKYDEYAVMAGFGFRGNNYIRTQTAQVGYTRVLGRMFNRTDSLGKNMCTRPIPPKMAVPRTVCNLF